MREAFSRETTEGTVYNVSGGDWEDVLGDVHEDRIAINFGPQHPSSHGVLRLILELEGETVTDCRPVEAPRGVLGAHVVSDGGTRPYRVHFREPSFVNIQCLPALVVGGLLSDVIPCIASVDSLMGGCDR